MLEELKEFAIEIKKDTGATLMLVGGAVRDMVSGFTGKHSKDWDLEVFGILPSAFEVWLTCRGFGFKIEHSSKFPVIRMIMNNQKLEIGFPRLENKTGPKHSDFEVTVKPDMTFEEASQRRDFTINAMGYNLITDELLDSHRGQEDLEMGILSVVNVLTFREDSLRIIRAMQFIARFELNPSNVFCAINQNMVDELKALDPTSIWQEFQKMINKGTTKGIEMALDFLVALSNNFELFPILHNMQETEQSPKWHSEGNVFNHTKLVIKAVMETTDNKTLSFLLALCHDMGKPDTMKITPEKITFHQHENYTDEALHFLTTIGCPIKLKSTLIKLIRKHMIQSNIKDKTLYRYASELAETQTSLHYLFLQRMADMNGAIYEDDELKEKRKEKMNCFKNRINKLGIMFGTLPSVINGNDILDIKKVDGKVVGALLKEVRNLQFVKRCQTKEEAINYITKRMNKYEIVK